MREKIKLIILSLNVFVAGMICRVAMENVDVKYMLLFIFVILVNTLVVANDLFKGEE